MDVRHESYRVINRHIVCILTGGIVLSLALLKLSRAFPGHFTTCASMRWFGVRCPLCGVTRGLDALLRADFHQAVACNFLTIPIAALAVMEFAYRLWIVVVRPREDRIPALRTSDLRIHVVLLATYLAYVIWFYAG